MRDLVAADVAHLFVGSRRAGLAVEEDLARRRSAAALDEAHDRQAVMLLPQPDSPDDAERLAVADLERDAVDGLDHPVLGEEVRLETLDLEEVSRTCRRSVTAVTHLDPLARVERVAQAVAQEAGGQDDQDQDDARVEDERSGR